jgi:DNA-damage-inducible protein D
MKTEEIKQLFIQFEAAASELEGIECWSGRELQILLGYSKWENFENLSKKGKMPVKMQERKLGIIFPTSGKRYQCPRVQKKK